MPDLVVRLVVGVALVVAFGGPCFAQTQTAAPACPQVAAVVIPTARLPSTVWDTMPGWSALVAFRIDPADGSPRTIEVLSLERRSADAKVADEPLKRATIETIERYRFCMPADLDPARRYSAMLRFTPVRSSALYVQAFEPSYSREDVDVNRSGRVVVKTTFGVDGVPSQVDIQTSSGDIELDRKAASATLSARLVTRDGRPLPNPLTFSQPFEFQIQSSNPQPSP